MDLQTVLKLGLTLFVMTTAVFIGKKLPSLAGLIATMPLTGVLVMVWLYQIHQGSNKEMVAYAKGALFGMLPSLLFFLVAFLCFKKALPLPWVLGISFGIWLMGALLHQWALR